MSHFESRLLNPPLKWSIPIFISFALCAVYFVMLQTIRSGALPHFLAVAKLTPLTLKPTYNYLPLVDKALGPLVIFFIAAFYEPWSLTFSVAADFAWSLGSVSLWQALEAERVGGSMVQGILPTILSCIPLWDFVGRRVGWSAVVPFWLLTFLHAPAHARGARIGRVKAESVLFGWWIGHNLPFAAVFFAGLSSTSVPLYSYALAPILTYYTAKIYLALRISLTDPKTLEQYARQPGGGGYGVLKLAYGSAFIVSAISRAYFVLIPAYRAASDSPTRTALGFVHGLKAFFVPAHGFRQPPPELTNAQSGILHFVQANKTIGFSVVWLAILWDLALRRASSAQAPVVGGKGHSNSLASTVVWGLKLMLSLVAISVCFGPGAATAAILAHREAYLQKEHLKSEKKS